MAFKRPPGKCTKCMDTYHYTVLQIGTKKFEELLPLNFNAKKFVPLQVMHQKVVPMKGSFLSIIYELLD